MSIREFRGFGLLEQSALAMMVAVFAAAVFILTSARTARAQSAAQETFSSPEDAMHALVQAVNAKDRVELAKLFGLEYKDLLSGDAVEDDKDLADFDAGLQESAQLQKQNDASFTVLVGKNDWPFPVPIETEKNPNQWFFDTKDGLQQILDRRIGENELSAIATARAYVVAQWEYFTDGDWGHDGVNAYAQKFVSTPGTHDGLYWESADGDPQSPLGSLVAQARSEGYGPQNRSGSSDASSSSNAPANTGGHRPFHGYYFKILTRQGPNAPGGKYNYVINGNMIAGFALVAYPDKWGNSGVMTFIVNQQGRVYEKNLGPNTEKIAAAMTEYNPDTSWKMVDSQQGGPGTPATIQK